jgi:membrane-associated phospholipid phosphatase
MKIKCSRRTVKDEATSAMVQTRSRGLVLAVMSMTLFGLPVLLIAFAIRENFDPLIALDMKAITAATDFTRKSGLASVLIILEAISRPVVVYIIATLVVLWAWLARHLAGRALWAFVTMMVSWAVGAVSKVVVQRARPALDPFLAHPQGYSFPSSHAFNITVAAGVMVVLLWPLLSAVGRRLVVGIALVVVLLVGLDRVFLGVHFPSDVFAGVLLGLALVVSSWIAFLGWTAPSSSPAPSRPV